MIMPLGKYKGMNCKEILEIDPNYVEWFINNVEGNTIIRGYFIELLKVKFNNQKQKAEENIPISKLENEIKFALIKNGRTESEADSFISIFKKQILK